MGWLSLWLSILAGMDITEDLSKSLHAHEIAAVAAVYRLGVRATELQELVVLLAAQLPVPLEETEGLDEGHVHLVRQAQREVELRRHAPDAPVDRSRVRRDG